MGKCSKSTDIFGAIELMNMKMNLEIHIRFEETSIDTQTIFGVHLIWMLKNGLEFQAQKASRPLLLIKGLRFGDSQVTSASSHFMFLELFLYQVVYISWPSWQPWTWRSTARHISVLLQGPRRRLRLQAVVPKSFKHETVSTSNCLNTFKARVQRFKPFEHIHRILEIATLILERSDLVTLFWRLNIFKHVCLNTFKQISTFESGRPGRLKCNNEWFE
jgi:hypothetical protein